MLFERTKKGYFEKKKSLLRNRLRRRTSDQTVLGSNPAVAAALSPWTRLFTPIVPRRSLHISFYELSGHSCKIYTAKKKKKKKKKKEWRHSLFGRTWNICIKCKTSLPLGQLFNSNLSEKYAYTHSGDDDTKMNIKPLTKVFKEEKSFRQIQLKIKAHDCRVWRALRCTSKYKEIDCEENGFPTRSC